MLATNPRAFWLRRSLALDAVICRLEAQRLSPARRDVLRRQKARLEPKTPAREVRR